MGHISWLSLIAAVKYGIALIETGLHHWMLLAMPYLTLYGLWSNMIICINQSHELTRDYDSATI